MIKTIYMINKDDDTYFVYLKEGTGLPCPICRCATFYDASIIKGALELSEGIKQIQEQIKRNSEIKG